MVDLEQKNFLKLLQNYANFSNYLQLVVNNGLPIVKKNIKFCIRYSELKNVLTMLQKIEIEGSKSRLQLIPTKKSTVNKL